MEDNTAALAEAVTMKVGMGEMDETVALMEKIYRTYHLQWCTGALISTPSLLEDVRELYQTLHLQIPIRFPSQLGLPT